MLARAVTFDGVSKQRMDEMRQEMESGQAPEGLDAKELLVLHDPEAEQSLVLVFFEDDDAYRRGDEILGGMDPGDTPGRRTSVRRYDVAMRQTM
jgi:hypothetical protein